jgi:hypothetical protein
MIRAGVGQVACRRGLAEMAVRLTELLDTPA